MVTSTGFAPELDSTLPNGAKIICRKRIKDIWIWLAYFGGYQPWVTWVSHDRNPGGTMWGNYFCREENALKDFICRCADYGDLYC
jgi:hypothetical protein